MTVDEFERFTDNLDEPFELIDGQPIRKPDMKPPHIWITERLARLLRRMLPEGDGWSIRDDKPVQFSEFNLPRPDIAVVGGDEDTYETRYPMPEDVALLIEASATESRLRYDHDTKRLLYASSNIPAYWIVNAVDRQVEVYTDPRPDGYATCVVFKPGQSVPVMINGAEVGQIAVNDVLPRIVPPAGGNGA
jgi:Uma2 family endonuclease